jgi:hypothetical protein
MRGAAVPRANGRGIHDEKGQVIWSRGRLCEGEGGGAGLPQLCTRSVSMHSPHPARLQPSPFHVFFSSPPRLQFCSPLLQLRHPMRIALLGIKTRYQSAQVFFVSAANLTIAETALRGDARGLHGAGGGGGKGGGRRHGVRR